MTPFEPTEYPPMKGPQMVCKTCRRPLEHLETHFHSSGKVLVEYQHAAGVPGVEPCTNLDPIPAAELGDSVVSVCDFCSGIPVMWEYPTGNFAMTLNATTDYGLSDNWLACDPCHDNIEADSWSAIVDRWVEGMRALGHGKIELEDARVKLTSLWQSFTMHRRGPAFRIGIEELQDEAPDAEEGQPHQDEEEPEADQGGADQQ